MALEYNSGMPVGPPISFEEFLEWELAQEAKHEFVGGVVVAFAGGTLRHAAITAKLLALIVPAARPCRTGTSDILIQMSHSARYADVVVTCDERDRLDDRTLRYPKLILEVLSESTSAVDRSEKLEEYTAIDTLDEYVMVDSRKRWVQVIRRSREGWNLLPPQSSETLQLRSIDLAIDLDDLYEDQDLAPVS